LRPEKDPRLALVEIPHELDGDFEVLFVLPTAAAGGVPRRRQVAAVGRASDLDQPLRAAAHRADVMAERRTGPARPA
jgi:hypothetical protein